MNKFRLGDTVEVSYIGRITKIEINAGEIVYEIAEDAPIGLRTLGMNVKENNIFPLPLPKDF